MKVFLKLLATGILTTICRIIFQLLLPSSTQTVLEPSIFVKNGTLPLAFSLLAIFAYSSIAGLFLLVQSGISGTSNQQGMKYALALNLVWAVYLFEPLAHATSIMLDSVAYVIADGISLFIMGFLLGVFFKCDEKVNSAVKDHKTIILVVIPIILFVLGRVILYKVVNIYAVFNTQPLKTFVWCTIVGLVTSLVVIWLTKQGQSIVKALLIYAINLIFFNSFMLLVFDFSMIDLAFRTGVDIMAISIGAMITIRYRKLVKQI